MMNREILALTFFHEAHKFHLHMNYDPIVWKLIPDKMQTKCRRENEKINYCVIMLTARQSLGLRP